MIFYFTGTGNSQYAAQSIAADGETLVPIVECLRRDEYDFTVADGESLGVVTPVYFGGLPLSVEQFLGRLRLSGKPGYVYGLLTYGGFSAGAGSMLSAALAEAGLTLDAVYGVKMPDNYVMRYDAPTEAEEQKLLKAASEKLARIKTSVVLRGKSAVGTSLPGRALTAALYPGYVNGRDTAPFHVNDKCIGCAACANRCPSRAIEMRDGHPIWVKDKCAFCMSCVRCGAVEYGDKLTGKPRYKHPMLRKRNAGHDHGSHDHGAYPAPPRRRIERKTPREVDIILISCCWSSARGRRPSRCARWRWSFARARDSRRAFASPASTGSSLTT